VHLEEWIDGLEQRVEMLYSAVGDRGNILSEKLGADLRSEIRTLSEQVRVIEERQNGWELRFSRELSIVSKFGVLEMKEEESRERIRRLEAEVRQLKSDQDEQKSATSEGLAKARDDRQALRDNIAQIAAQQAKRPHDEANRTVVNGIRRELSGLKERMDQSVARLDETVTANQDWQGRLAANEAMAKEVSTKFDQVQNRVSDAFRHLQAIQTRQSTLDVSGSTDGAAGRKVASVIQKQEEAMEKIRRVELDVEQLKRAEGPKKKAEEKVESQLKDINEKLAQITIQQGKIQQDQKNSASMESLLAELATMRGEIVEQSATGVWDVIETRLGEWQRQWSMHETSLQKLEVQVRKATEQLQKIDYRQGNLEEEYSSDGVTGCRIAAVEQNQEDSREAIRSVADDLEQIRLDEHRRLRGDDRIKCQYDEVKQSLALIRAVRRIFWFL
jgi:DNA repair exonuclease SbcCD ATPase subunit